MVVSTKLYDLLEVSTTASSSEIKKAYRKLVLVHHPDKNGGDDTKFKEIDAAYKVLSDDNLRQVYDATGSVDKTTMQENPDFDILSHLFGNFKMGGGMNMGDIFGSAFGGGSQHQAKRTSDVMHEIGLPLETFFTGKTKTLSIKRQVVCTTCKGEGGTSPEKCQSCRGVGVVMVQQQSGFMMFQTHVKCSKCNGKGKIIKAENECKICSASGYKNEKQSVEITIPPGIPNNYVYTLKGYADEKVGMDTGNLHIILQEKKHDRYVRNGVNLETTVAIDLSTALVGGVVEFAHLDGSIVTLTLPKGKVVRQGSTLMVKKKGMPTFESPDVFGDLKVTFHVEFPTDEWSKKANDSQIRKILS